MRNWYPSYTACGVLAAAFLFAYPVRAYDLYPNAPAQMNSESVPVSQSLESSFDTFSSISGPVSGFIDSLRRVSSQGTPITQALKTSSAGITSGSFYADANGWLRQTIGIDIPGAIRRVGILFIWIIKIAVSVLNFVSNLIAAGISYI